MIMTSGLEILFAITITVVALILVSIFKRDKNENP
jgi:hypothetical protein